MRRFIFVLLLALATLSWHSTPVAAAASASIPPPGMFQLPFPLGDTWTFNGVHGAHKEAIDFSVGRPWPRWRADTSQIWVVAAAPGTIRKTSSCGFEIDHADGWTTVYYHVEHILRDSGMVQANEKLAVIANTPREAICEGGSATGPHLHFGLKSNGQDVPIDGMILSGWRIHSGRGRYDSNCARMYIVRGEQRLCPYTDALTNTGIPADGDNGTALAQNNNDDSPLSGGAESVQIEVDSVADRAVVQGVMSVQGWAIDHAAPDGTGIDHIHVYLDGPAGEGTFLAEASYAIARSDVAQVLGDERFRPAGFAYEWDTAHLSPGQHVLFIYAHSVTSGWSFTSRTVVVKP